MVELFDDPAVRRFSPAPAIVDLRSARRWCRDQADWTDGSHRSFTIVEHDADEVVGTCSLWGINQAQRSAEVGYRIAAPWRGRGIARAAASAVAAYGFEAFRLRRVQLHHATDNPASCAVALGAGFELEGHLRQSYRDHLGVVFDEHLHARLESDPSPMLRGPSVHLELR